MKAIRAAIAGILALFVASAAVAQTFPTVPANSVIGRLGVGSGPSQAIPFSVLVSRLFNPAFPIDVSTGGIKIIGSPSPNNTGQNGGGPPTEYYGLYSNLTAASNTHPEWGAMFVMSSSVGAGIINYYKAGLGSVMTVNPGSSPAWAQSNILTVKSGVGNLNAIGFEMDVNNYNKSYTLAMEGTTELHAVNITGDNTSGFYITSAIRIGATGAITPFANYGILLGTVGYPTFNTATITDRSSSPISLQIEGTHTIGISTAGATVTYPLLVGNNQQITSNSSSAGVSANLTVLDTGDIQQFGTSTVTKGHQFNGNPGATSTPIMTVINSHATAGDIGLKIGAGNALNTDGTSVLISFYDASLAHSVGSINRAGSGAFGVLFNTGFSVLSPYSLAMSGSTSGTATIQAQATAGTPTLTLPNASGTLAVSASAPLVLSATTGNLTCPTCTNTITGTAPITVTGTVVSLDDAGVTYAKIQNLGALAVMGRTANSSGVGADIQATAASGAVLRESGSVIGFGTIATAGIANNAVTLAKLATQATNTVLVNATSGTAVPTAQSVSTCSTAASALNWTTNTGFGCNTSITANAVAVGGISGLGTGVATWLATPSGTNLATALTTPLTRAGGGTQSTTGAFIKTAIQTFCPTGTNGGGNCTTSVAAAGTATYTATTGALYVKVTCVGAGGGGGASNGASGGQAIGAGGGSGNVVTVNLTAAAASGQTVTMGTGGAGGAAGANNGANGTASSLGSLCVSAGGTGGGYSQVGVQAGAAGAGATGGTGDVKGTGTGGQAGIAGAFTTLGLSGGAGGNLPPYGGGGPALGSGSSSAGNNASGFGGGGSGAGGFSTASTFAGGNGGSTIVIIEEYLNQ